ncbi:MAG: hypothetical protein K0U54_13235 [Bacteroidetes bacterium]|nr:hypothetical protein [Bacteroidota bacterium]
MNLKQTIIRIVLFNVLTSFSILSWATVQLIASVGQPAADFPQGFIYKDISAGAAVIGSSGHIAFAGIADTNDGTTGNSTNVIWSGLPGQLQAIIKENQSIDGLPENILIEKFSSTIGSPAQIIVNRSGDVALLASMKGPATGDALLLHTNGGSTLSVLMSGAQAPGFPPGAIVQISNFGFSDAGTVIQAQVIEGQSISSVVFFHDFEKLSLLPSPAPECEFGFFNPAVINDSGEIVLIVALDDDACTHIHAGKKGVFKWRNNQWETLAIDEQSVPNMADSGFFVPVENIFGIAGFARTLINDQGEIAFSPSIVNPSTFSSERGLWVIDELGDPKLLALNGETLANNASDIISPLANIFQTFNFTNGGFSIVKAVTSTFKDVVLAGFPRDDQPYISLEDITGTSQLAVVAQADERPPGFESTSFYVTPGESLALNRSGQFLFSGGVGDALTGNQISAFWRADMDTNPRLKIMDGMKITVNAEEHTIGLILSSFFGISTTIGGKGSHFSDNGHFLFDGTLSGTEALFLLLDDSKEQSIFSLAEQKFSQFFSPANTEDRLIEGFEYRFYPETNTYIGIKNNDVFILGDVFGSGPQRVGTIDETLQLLEAR